MIELSATHHGDHDEFWIVLKRDGIETGRINPRQVTEISWENAETLATRGLEKRPENHAGDGQPSGLPAVHGSPSEKAPN